MKWKETVAGYLTFTRKEQIGIITVLIIISIVIFSPTFFSDQNISKLEIRDSTWMEALKKLEKKEADKEKNNFHENEGNVNAYQYDPTKKNYNNNRLAKKLFYFDPNTISKDGWRQLGIGDKTIQTIQNYLGKGGRFKKPEDLQRVYGLHNDEYERLAPYVKIVNDIAESKSIVYVTNENESPGFSYSTIDINTADTASFISLPGIGSKLAARIVNFRDKLGGFYSINQVGETYGVPDSTFQKIKKYLKLENATVRKININTATVDELKVHPYIKWNIANPIVIYRNEHGSFSNVEGLKKIIIITDDVYKKIAPYLSTQ